MCFTLYHRFYVDLLNYFIGLEKIQDHFLTRPRQDQDLNLQDRDQDQDLNLQDQDQDQDLERQDQDKTKTSKNRSRDRLETRPVSRPYITDVHRLR